VSVAFRGRQSAGSLT